jgi:hypothetical protein
VARPARDRRAAVLLVLARAVYWIAVLAVSLALVFLLLRFFEARDDPELEQPAAALTAVGPNHPRPPNGAP